MDSDEAFLQAIAETPDDDAPRLIYADWLDDHGQGDPAGRVPDNPSLKGGRKA